MKRPRLLDLFCCQGLAAMGYHRAGWDVTGVDIAPQPRYPFPFVQADALAYLLEHGHEYDAVHTSPPCHAYTSVSNRWRGRGGVADRHPSLIGPTRAALIDVGKPWILENVVGARGEMREPVIVLAGAHFGLDVHRPRLFEASFLLLSPPPAGRGENTVAVYGRAPDGGLLNTRAGGGENRRASSYEQGSAAMGGCDWADWYGLTQGIPPAYTEFVGGQLLAAIDDHPSATPALVARA